MSYSCWKHALLTSCLCPATAIHDDDDHDHHDDDPGAASHAGLCSSPGARGQRLVAPKPEPPAPPPAPRAAPPAAPRRRQQRAAAPRGARRPLRLAVLGLEPGAYASGSPSLVLSPRARVPLTRNSPLQCSATCGWGQRVRRVRCEDMKQSKEAADSFCLKPRPNATQPCVQQARCITATWMTGEWTDCSADAACKGVSAKDELDLLHLHSDDITTANGKSDALHVPGGLGLQGAPQGKQRRTVQCVSSDSGSPAEEFFCMGERPLGSRLCKCAGGVSAAPSSPAPTAAPTPPTPPANLGGWRTGPWGQCSKSCGGGTQARRVVCASSECDDQVKPPPYWTCNHHACPSWSQDDWSRVSGTGALARAAVRVTYTTSRLARPCSLQCSVTCGPGGVQTRSFVCMSGQSQVLPDESCAAERPAMETRACPSSPPCQPAGPRGAKPMRPARGFAWRPSPWGQVSSLQAVIVTPMTPSSTSCEPRSFTNSEAVSVL